MTTKVYFVVYICDDEHLMIDIDFKTGNKMSFIFIF